MKKITALLCAAALLLTFNTAVFADTFSDVNENSFGWALSQIEDMASKGIINGYTDGTFGPARGITKTEAMLLIARIMGFTSSVYTDYIEDITALYADELDGYSLKYPKEISFLIYKGVFSLDEVLSMAKNKKLEEALVRYEAAEYLTRAMGQYEYVSENYGTDTGYDDNADIPSAYAPFVKYVRDRGLMLGMEDTKFIPDYQVNRAQMAVMLYRIIEQRTISISSGKISGYDSDKELLKVNTGSKIENFPTNDFDCRLNGENIAPIDLKTNREVILVYVDDNLVAVEALYDVPKASAEVRGQVKEIVLSSSKTISVINSDNDMTEKYIITDDCDVFYDNNRETLSSIRINDYVNLSLDSDSNVIRIDGSERTATYTEGIISSIKVDEQSVTINIEMDDGEILSFKPDNDIAVKRNSKAATLQDIYQGDEIIKFVTTYGKITSIELKSEIANSTGTISEITISANPSIKINKGGNIVTIPVSNSVQIYVDGQLSDIYALRMDMIATYTTDSDTITKIEVTQGSDITQYSGTVQVTNTSYGFVTIQTTTGESKQIYIKNTTKITNNSNGATKTIKDIKVGDYLVVIGAIKNGAYVASTVVIVQ